MEPGWPHRQHERCGRCPCVARQRGASGRRDQHDRRLADGQLHPRTRQLNLSQAVASQPSVAAAGIAAHETGHAIQHARGYVWGNVRTALVPVAQIGSGASIWFIVLGFILRFSGLIWLGIILYAGAVLFQLVTLPVEIDASRRAVAALSSSGLVAPDQIGGVKQVLTAAALTYVAAALVAAMQLLYFIGLARRN